MVPKNMAQNVRFWPKMPKMAQNPNILGHISGKNENMLMHIKNMW